MLPLAVATCLPFLLCFHKTLQCFLTGFLSCFHDMEMGRNSEREHQDDFYRNQCLCPRKIVRDHSVYYLFYMYYKFWIYTLIIPLSQNPKQEMREESGFSLIFLQSPLICGQSSLSGILLRASLVRMVF